MDYYRRHEAECEKKVPPASVDAAQLPRRSEVAWPEKPVAISDSFKQANGKMDRGAKESDPFAYQSHRHITAAANSNGLDDKVPPPATPSRKSLDN